MSKQLIGVGTTANDGTGDTDRAAWIKANADFNELYPAAIPVTPVAGRYYRPVSLAGLSLTTGAAMGVNIARFLPVFFPYAQTVDQLFATFTTGGTNYQCAFYNDNNGQPGTEICHSASATPSTTFAAGALSTGSTAVIPAGIVWMGINVDNALTVAHTMGTNAIYADALIGSSTGTDLRNGAGTISFSFTTPLTFGTWGDLTSATFTKAFTAANAVVGYRAA